LGCKTLKKEAECFSETSINIYKLTRLNIQADLNSKNLHYISHSVLQFKPIVCDTEIKKTIVFLA